jgi:hypothetical protein
MDRQEEQNREEMERRNWLVHSTVHSNIPKRAEMETG